MEDLVGGRFSEVLRVVKGLVGFWRSWLSGGEVVGRRVKVKDDALRGLVDWNLDT